MNPVLRHILETRQIKAPSGETVPLHSHIPRDEGENLQQIIRQIKPRVSVEIGCAYGISSLYICEALAEVGAEHHIIIDPNQFSGWQGIGIEHLKAAGYASLVELQTLPSHQALPRLEAAGIEIDFAFVDGAHWFDYVMVDFFCLDRMLKVGGVIVFDDANWPGVRKACRYVLSNRAYSVFPPPANVNGRKGSWARRLLTGTPVVRKHFDRLAKQEIVQPDWELHLPLPDQQQYVAVVKEAKDTWISEGEKGKEGQRTFTFHREF